MNENNGQGTEGEAWVKARSKKCGRFYYYNTVTSESVWHLSEADLKKARQCQTGERGLPEPPSDNTETMPQVKYDNIIVNKLKNITTQQYPSALEQCNYPCNSFNNIPGIYPPSMFWPYPQQHPAFLNMPVPDHAIIPVQNTSVPLSSRFKMISQIKNEDTISHQVKVNLDLEPTKSTLCNNQPETFDLRQVLKAKMKLRSEATNSLQSSEAGFVKDPDLSVNSQIHDSNEIDMLSIEKNTYPSDTWVSTAEQEKVIEIDPNNSVANALDTVEEDSGNDEKWLAENMRCHGKKSILDLTSLRELCKHTGTDCWYLLPDTNVFFHHLIFLNILVNSDEQCRLLVVQRVYNEVMLKARTKNNSKLNTRARSACRYIDQLLRSGQAVMDHHLLCDANNVGYPDGDDEILDCCLRLEKYNFILLTNDNLLLEKTNTTSIEAFKVTQLKNYLAFFQGRSAVNFKRPINITIDNEKPSFNIFETRDDNRNIGGTDPTLQTVHCVTDSQIELDNSQAKPIVSNQIKISVANYQNGQSATNTEKHLNKNNKLDANGNSNGLKYGIALGIPNNKGPEESKSVSKSNNVLYANANSTRMTLKKRVIRLNRNTPIKQSTAPCSNNKNLFRWRRRRDTKDLVTKTSHENSNEILSLNSVNNETPKTIPQKPNNSEESVKRIIAYQQNSTVVEESSATGSDVISNTRSSVLSDRGINFKQAEKNNESDNNNVAVSSKHNGNKTFRVTDSIMDEMLSMGMEEWVSRFLQIMEEALNMVLQNHKELLEASMRAPWTVQEATDCIRKCFKKYHRVHFAANCLFNTMANLRDNKGNISYNITPAQYMMMFSHGVYLINILQSDVENSDDIETSKQMLSTLLEDIKHPQIHNTSIETNCDNSKDARQDKELYKLPMPSSDSREFLQQNLTEFKEIGNEMKQSPREQLVIKSFSFKEKQIEQTVKFNRKFNNITLETLKKESLQRKQLIASNNETKSVVADTNKNTAKQDDCSFQPKIIMKFNKCSEFEDRIKRNKHLVEDILDDLNSDVLDYEGDADDQADENRMYNSDMDNAINENGCTDENDQYSNGTECGEDNDQNFNPCSKLMKGDNGDDATVETNTNIEMVVKSFLKSIRGTLIQAQDFCVKVQSEFCNSEYVSVIRRMELQEQARDQQSNVKTLLETMKSILNREKNKESRIYLTNLRSHIPKSRLSSYGEIIGEVAVQSTILLKALDFVFQMLVDS